MTSDFDKRVLILDGVDADAEALTAVLRASSETRYAVDRSETLEDALERLHDPRAYDLVVADLALAGAQALVVLLRITDAAPHATIALYTSVDDDALALRAFREGAQEYALKGQIEPEQLLRRLRYAIERKVADERMHEHMLDVQQSQRMEAIGRLAGGFAHDFNNALTTIHGYTALLMDAFEPGTEALDDAGEIMQAVERATELTRKLSTFSRAGEYVPVPMDLSEVIENNRKTVARLVGDAIEVRTAPSHGIWRTLIDEGSAEQILVQLALNAKDAMPEGGTLTIGLVNADLNSTALVQHPEIEPGRYVQIEVADTGVGMNEAVKLQIFEPFFSAKGQGGGPGLGLSSLYGIVKHFGGHVLVYSEPGLGATFKVLLPALADEPTVEDLIPQFNASEYTVLVVDDDADVRGAVVAQVTREGYKVLGASSGAEALSVSDDSAQHIHLVLCDVVLPDAHGPDIVERIQHRRRKTVAVYMSAYPGATVTERGLVPEHMPFVSKPVSQETLRSTLRDALSRTQG